jgi:hypothetical protein
MTLGFESIWLVSPSTYWCTGSTHHRSAHVMSEGREVSPSEELVLTEYRLAMLPAEQKAREDFDKTVKNSPAA